MDLLMRPQFIQRPWNHVFPPKPGTADAIFLAGPAERPDWWDESINFMPWPAWLPRQLYITHARLSHQVEKGPYTQSLVSIDYGGRCLRSGLPPWYQQLPNKEYADWSGNANLVSLWPSDLEPHDVVRHWGEVAPFFFNADEDILWCQLGGLEGDVWFFNLGFLAPSPCVDVLPLVAPSWDGMCNVVGPIYMDGAADYTGYTLSSYFSPHWIKNKDAGTEVEVTFAAGTASLVIGSAYIGPGASDHSMSASHQLFDGSSGTITIAPNTTATMTASVGIDGATGYVVRAHVVSGDVKYRSTAPVDLHEMGQGWGVMNAAGDHAADLSASAFLPGNAAVTGVAEIKQHY